MGLSDGHLVLSVFCKRLRMEGESWT